MTGSAASDAGQGADAVVVAAGSSRRMGGVDKLAALVAGRPLLAWSVAAIAASSRVERVVLVVAPERVAGVAAAGWLPPGCEVVAGGSTRQASVAAIASTRRAATARCWSTTGRARWSRPPSWTR
jgi:2-C-methyl-D-erythritol 4-phosphate cytidylyltransferase/2-C-methyl-D-erythritol 2,4-cyclodiphosphate synthase